MANSICPNCGTEQHPYALTSWKCPKCGCVRAVNRDEVLERLARLEERMAAIEKRNSPQINVTVDGKAKSLHQYRAQPAHNESL